MTVAMAPALSQPGSYALLLTAKGRRDRLAIGARGALSLEPGHYVYLGSAFGPGGLGARLRHHLNEPRRLHWHIDYLRSACELQGAWLASADRDLEHAWATSLLALPQSRLPMPGFGSSDCQCSAHLVVIPAAVSWKKIGLVLAADGHAPEYMSVGRLCRQLS